MCALVAYFGSKGVDLEKAPGYLDVIKHPIGECSFSITDFFLCGVESKAFHFVGHPLARRLKTCDVMRACWRVGVYFVLQGICRSHAVHW